MNSNSQLMHPVRRCYIKINKVFLCCFVLHTTLSAMSHNLYAVIIILTKYLRKSSKLIHFCRFVHRFCCTIVCHVWHRREGRLMHRHVCSGLWSSLEIRSRHSCVIILYCHITFSSIIQCIVCRILIIQTSNHVNTYHADRVASKEN